MTCGYFLTSNIMSDLIQNYIHLFLFGDSLLFVKVYSKIIEICGKNKNYHCFSIFDIYYIL